VVDYYVEVLEYIDTVAAETYTDATNIYITNHGLSDQDMIVNTDKRLTSDDYGNRGSRAVSDASDPDILVIANAIDEQEAGDVIRLYKYRDISGMLKPGTFRLVRKGGGQSTLDFQIVTTHMHMFQMGQFIRVRVDVGGGTDFVFWGAITSHDEELLGSGQTELMQTIACEGLNCVAARRTVTLGEVATTNYATIVTSMADKYLYGEGITKGTIDTGAVLQDDWNSDAISIKEILDECASKSGFEWFIDDNCALQFRREFTPVPDATHALRPDMGEIDPWRNYTKLKVSSRGSDYFNKLFFVGGAGESRDSIVLFRDDNTAIDAMQDFNAGTGAFGSVIRDTSLAEADYRSVEAGSTTETINITGHAQNIGDTVWNYTTKQFKTVATTPTADSFTVSPGFSAMAVPTTPSATAEAGTTTEIIKLTAHGRIVGEMLKNETRSEYRFILAVDADHIIVDAITGQVAGDSIRMGGHIMVFFGEINNILAESLKKQSIDPTTITFSTPDVFYPQTKLAVDVFEIGQYWQTFYIEDVEVVDIGKGLSNCWYNVKATKRNASNFSVQRKNSYLDFWRDF
jgi:hypothetical protein